MPASGRPFTIDAMVDKVRDLVGPDQVDRYATRASIAEQLNEVRADLFSLENWPFLQQTVPVAVQAGDDTVTYSTLGDEWNVVRGVTVEFQGNRFRLTPSTDQQLDERLSGMEGRPAMYVRQSGTNLRLWPAPAEDVVVHVDVYGLTGILGISADPWTSSSPGSVPVAFVSALCYAAASNVIRFAPETYHDDGNGASVRADAFASRASIALDGLRRTFLTSRDEGIFTIGQARDWNWGVGAGFGRSDGEPLPWQW